MIGYFYIDNKPVPRNENSNFQVLQDFPGKENFFYTVQGRSHSLTWKSFLRLVVLYPTPYVVRLKGKLVGKNGRL